MKDNQKTLHEDVKLFFNDAIAPEGQGDRQRLTHTAEPDNGHGRPDQRTVRATEPVGWLRRRHPDGTDLRGIVCVEGRRLDFATGKQSVQRRYDLTSLDPWRDGAQRLGERVRGHWSIENQLH